MVWLQRTVFFYVQYPIVRFSLEKNNNLNEPSWKEYCSPCHLGLMQLSNFLWYEKQQTLMECVIELCFIWNGTVKIAMASSAAASRGEGSRKAVKDGKIS